MPVWRRYTGLREVGKGRPSCEHTVKFSCGVNSTWGRGCVYPHILNLDSGWNRTTSVATLTAVFSPCVLSLIKGEGTAVPLQAWSGPEGSRKLGFPDFMTTVQDGGKVVSLTHRPPLPPGNTLGTHFCKRLSRPQGYSATGRIMSRKNSNDTIGNGTRDLPVCSVVP
jgi:hypothetical protein